LIGVLTVVAIAASTELIARALFPASQEGLENCFVKDNATGDEPVRPNTACWEQIAESRVRTEYKFNSRGHRAGTELVPKAAGTYRIVLIGSSMTMGLFVPREQTFAGLLPGELSEKTGKKVEVYNEAPGGKFRGGTFPTRDSVQQFHEVLEAQPDLILWVITPWDAVNAGFEGPGQATAQPAEQKATAPSDAAPDSGNLWDRLVAKAARGNFTDRLNYHWEQSRSSIVLKHLLFANDSQDAYVKSYLRNEDFAGFLKAEPGPKWHGQLQSFDNDVAEIEGKAEAAGVPFVAVLVPNRAQAAMINMGVWPAGYDPYVLDHEIRDVVVSHGGTYIDILPDYRGILSPEQDYFPVDGHPDADGHALIARLLTKGLTSGAVPALKAASQPQVASEQSR